jgi:hypothetical protein
MTSVSAQQAPHYNTTTGQLTDAGRAAGAPAMSGGYATGGGGGGGNSQYAYGRAPNDPQNQFNTQTGQPNPNWSGNQTQPNTIVPSGDPTVDNYLKSINTSGWTSAQISAFKAGGVALVNAYQQGKIPSSFQLTPSNLAQLLQIATTQTDPQTQQVLKNEIAHINQNIQNYGNQFVNTQGKLIQDFQTNLGQEQNASGAAGTTMSGLRNLTENRMVAGTNRDLSSLQSSTASTMGDLYREGATAVGGANNQFNMMNLNGASVNNQGGQYGSVQGNGSLSYNYDPSKYTIGSIQQAGAKAAQDQQNTWISQYGNLASNPNNYTRTASDLLGTIPSLSGNTFS